MNYGLNAEAKNIKFLKKKRREYPPDFRGNKESPNINVIQELFLLFLKIFCVKLFANKKIKIDTQQKRWQKT